MSHSEEQICPWCQTEIVWDPEIGPEPECPHCFNELGGYRSIQLTVKQTGQPIEFDDTDDEDEDYESYDEFDENELQAMDEYEEGAQRVLDHQETAPECSSCQSFMLLAGTQTAGSAFIPVVQKTAGAPILSEGYSTEVFVCPSCLRVEHILAEKDRLKLAQLLKQVGSQ